IAHSDEGEKKENHHLLLELLTPVAKTYPSELGRIAINNGLQVLGGYGYCMDFPLQQYLRDIRIMAIYEGTTGIQSLDLLGRKIPMNNGKALQLLTEMMNDTILECKKHQSLSSYAVVLESKINEIQKVLSYLMSYAMKGDNENYLADATIFMEMAANTIIGYQWLKMGLAAQIALDKGDNTYEKEFYDAKLHTMKFYFKYELPKTIACMETIMHGDKLTLVDENKELIF
ncbi:MAG: acyl-CoA dehydrogenase, partial [Saprospiraceae bacterium]